MKRLATAVAVASIFAASAANATSTAPQGFNVKVNLTSDCTVSAIADVQFAYTSFQAAAQASTGGGFTVTCTNTLPYTMALSAASGTVIGLNYTLALSAAGGTGNGLAQAYTINGNMAAGQSGNCATAGGACSGTDNTKTLTVSY